MTRFRTNRRMRRGGAPKGRRGFTLIELLVVIAVLALLVSILVPSLREALEYARLVTCRLNMRNLSMACMIYVDDNNEYWVPSDADRLNLVKSATWRNGGQYSWGWPGHLAADGALEQTGILVCPGFRMPHAPDRAEKMSQRLHLSPETWLRDTTYPGPYTYMWGNYALHTHNHKSDFYIKDWHFSAIFTGRQIIMAEAVNAFGAPSGKPEKIDYGTHHGPAFDSEINIAFSDGSIESIVDYSDMDRWDYWHAGNPLYYYPNNDRYSWGFWRVFKHGGVPN